MKNNKKMITAILILLLCISIEASAKNCQKGIRCGNSCISAQKTCRINTINYPIKTKTQYSNTTTKLDRQVKNDRKNQAINIPETAKTSEKSISNTVFNKKIVYRCLYSSADISNNKLGEMKNHYKSNVDVDGSFFIAQRPDGTLIKSPQMNTIEGNFFIEHEKRTTYVMTLTKNEFAISSLDNALTEQWAECLRQ